MKPTILISSDVADLFVRLLSMSSLSPAAPEFEHDALLMIKAKRQLAGEADATVEG